MNLGAFTSNSQNLKKYVCLVHVQSSFTESSHVTAEFVYINGSDGGVPPVNIKTHVMHMVASIWLQIWQLNGKWGKT